MALIDFSNAKIEIDCSDSTKLIIQQYFYLLGSSGIRFYGEDKTTQFSISRQTTVTNTPSKYAVEFIGTVPSSMSGTGTVMYVFQSTRQCYKISNISYNPGDNFDFIIEAEITTT